MSVELILKIELVVLLITGYILVLLLFNDLSYKVSKRFMGGVGLGVFVAGLVRMPMDKGLLFAGAIFIAIDATLEAIRGS